MEYDSKSEKVEWETEDGREKETKMRKRNKSCWGNLSKPRYVSIKKWNWNWQAKEITVYQQKFKIHVALVTMFKAVKDYLEALHLHWTVLCHALVKVSEQLRCIWMAYITFYQRENLETKSWIYWHIAYYGPVCRICALNYKTAQNSQFCSYISLQFSCNIWPFQSKITFCRKQSWFVGNSW